MTGRSVAVQGVLAAAALVAAYATWQREPELGKGEAIVVDVSKGDLEKIRYQDDELKSWVELVRDKDANGSFIGVRLSGSDASGAALPSGHPVVVLKVPERLVRGNESAKKLFDRFGPLRASRALGVLDAAKLKELGLDTTKKHLEVVGRGTKRRFAIVPAPSGANEPYIRDEQDGRVYVVSRPVLSDMQAAATNLVERKMHDFRLEEVDRVVLTAGGKTKEWKALRMDDMPGIRLAPMATPDKPDETAKTWHDRVWNLFPSEVLGKGENPDGAAPKLSAKVEYFMRGRSLGFVELARAAPAASNESTAMPAPAPEIAYGRSEFTLGWAKLPGEAFSLVAEGEKLAGR